MAALDRPLRRGPRDGCAVWSHELAAIVADFVREWERERPIVNNSAPVPLTACDYLARETGLNRDWIERLARLTRGSSPRLGPTVSLRVADRIVTAAGRPFVFHDGQLEVVPNPMASRAARRECCGGSRAS